jgi:hypothetical protein
VVSTAFRPAALRTLRHPLTIPIVVFVLAFLYRFNALGGSLGGFDGDHFIYYLGAKAVAHGERPLRDFADAGVMGAWPALSYELPALAQRILGETFFAEAVFSVGLLAFALAVTARTAAALSGKLSAVIVTVATLCASTKLYGYSKVLVFAVAAALFVRYVKQPTRARAIELAVWSAVAFLFRHDFLIYLAVPVAIVILGSTRWRDAVDRLLVYAGTVVLLLALPLYSIQHYVGIGSYIETARALVAQEANRTTFRWPQFVPGTGDAWSYLSVQENAIAWLFDLSIVIPILALLTLAGSPRAKDLDTRQTRVVIASLAVLALLLDRFFLRNNFGARFGDLGAPIAILAAWVPASVRDAAPWVRGLVWTTAVLVLVPTMMALSTTGSVWHELDTTGLSDSPKKIGRRLVAVTTDLSALPSRGVVPPDAEPNAVEYVRTCTAATDRVLVVADAPEILAMAGRPFAGGHPTFRPGFYTLEQDQRQTLDRLARESVPVVLLDAQRYSHFEAQFRLIDQYVMGAYERWGELPAPTAPVQVLTLRGRSPSGHYRETGLPCFS